MLNELKRMTGEREGAKITMALEMLRSRRQDTGIQVIPVAGVWHLRTHPDNVAWVSRLVDAKPQRLSRYVEVTERSGAFEAGAVEVLDRSDLVVMWLEHLLVLSMLQQPTEAWRWGRYAVIHPSANIDLADACARYRGVLADDSTYAALTAEALLESGALPASTVSVVRDRYAW